jgi:hypothetical protein
MALRHAGSDSTSAVLTSLAGYNLLSGENSFQHPVFEELGRRATALIDEEPFQIDVGAL